ncbi:lipid A export permease/ATP-binding protein MsbA [Desulfobulbus rhabdoformis]|uniref:lipid A export permease/ATP-binding protein MsbA n=1 Tax=Desulfobulbus rhabdoformis TaxID=34032 RepID=UPI0019641CCF|nr:lipid A export permease/ATP-binding protein MsbA [Desulfobulbus rhabdoformis]MBM9613249.1 lipid A export permease/ATP-binding protein MsbA [Desulfobulbus rhabdoformis]
MSNREILRRMADVLKPYIRSLLIAMVAMIVVGGFNALQAYMVKPLLDEIFFNKNGSLLSLLPLGVVVVFVVKGVFYFLYTYLLEKVGLGVIRDLRHAVYAHINTLSLSYFHKTPTGKIISRIINDVNLLQRSVSYALIQLLRDLCSVAGLLGVIFYMDWRLALISLAFIPLSVGPIVFFGRRFRKISVVYQDNIGEATSNLHETIGGARIVKAFSMEKEEVQRFAGKLQEIMDTMLLDTKNRALSHPLTECIGGFGMAFIIWFGGREVLNGHSTPGTFMSFLTALILLYEPIKGVSKINSTFQQGAAAAGRIFGLLDIEPEIQERLDAVTLPPFEREIVLKDVTFCYEPNRPVLQCLNLRLSRGEILAIVGPSGSGKTTLANLIPRFYDVTEGSLKIDDHEIRDLTLHSLRSQIALVTQQTILFNDTVRNNIAYGRKSCTEEDVHQAAKAAFAYEFIKDLPQGFDTVIGESGSRLSGGQQQRVSIARAILKDAPILILDEATSSLDTESEREVQRALENLMQNRTTIIIAHRLSTVKNADRIIVLKDGHLVEEGTHESLLALQGEYHALHRLQFSHAQEPDKMVEAHA